MTDRPIIFSGPMVRALLYGRKTQTRRLLKPQPDTTSDPSGTGRLGCNNRYGYWHPLDEARPYEVGDRLYVREGHLLCHAFGQGRDDGMRWGPWGGMPTTISPDKTQIAYYRASFERCDPYRWRPSIHMPRWASRLTLTVTDVRVQRLQEISEDDARAEGVVPVRDPTGAVWFHGPSAQICGQSVQDGFRRLWNSLHGPDAWDANPWVIALTFIVEHRNIDAQETANA